MAKYPPHNEQKCDHCGKNHEAKKCKAEINGRVAGIHCKSCGHGDHEKEDCPLVPQGKKGFDMPDDIIEQFTPSFYEMTKKKKNKMMPETQATPSTPSIPSTPPGSLGTRGLPIQTKSSPPKVGSPKKDSNTEGAATEKKGSRVSEAQQKRWVEAEKLMPRPDPEEKAASSSTDKPLKIEANFFKIEIDSKIQLHRYSIILGEADARGPVIKRFAKDGTELPELVRKVKPETKKYLIQELLKAHPPHTDWATDYSSMIISAGPLYKGSANLVGQETKTPHPRTPKRPNDRPPVVDSSVRFLDIVDINRLNKHLAGKDHDYNPHADFEALNICSWKNITDGTFKGGRLRNKFYPDSRRDKSAETEGCKAGSLQLYFIRSGFFTSMRPGQGSVLLNINTTTSAFFSPVKLSAWVNKRWPATPSVANFRNALKGVRVTLDLHDESRQWAINGLSPNTTIEATMFQIEGHHRPTSVLDYLTESKYSIAECISTNLTRLQSIRNW